MDIRPFLLEIRVKPSRNCSPNCTCCLKGFHERWVSARISVYTNAAADTILEDKEPGQRLGGAAQRARHDPSPQCQPQ